MHRKRVIARFSELQVHVEKVNWNDKRGRSVIYGPPVVAALKDMWDISGEVCAERLIHIREELVENMQRFKHWKHGRNETSLLFAMSLGTMKAKIAKFSKVQLGGGRCMTKPSSLKELIPIRRGPWKDPEAGIGEIDTVAHCGSDASGTFAYTVQYTDIRTLWCLFQGQLSKNKHETLVSIKAMRGRLPMPMQGLDPDTGSEFVNWHCYDWCQENKIAMTRIRPGVSNDHGRIEQKNDKNIRKYVGYIRIDTEERVTKLSKLYEDLEVYINHFVPSMKCIEKVKMNKKKSTRVYDNATTPYLRVLLESSVSTSSKEKLERLHNTLDIFSLKQNIDRLRTELFKGARFTKMM